MLPLLIPSNSITWSTGKISRSNKQKRLVTSSALVETKNPQPPALTYSNNNYDIQVLESSERNCKASRRNDHQADTRAISRASNVTVFSAELLGHKYGSNPFKVLGRLLQIVIGLGVFLFKVYLDAKNGKVDERKRLRAGELRKILTALGPTFVKIGQCLSTRPDVCSPEYLDELEQLQNALPTFPDVEAFSCIEQELGMPLDSIYSSITPTPVAAASLGQVYKAKLKCSGEDVAVKVQRPNIEESIGLDFYLIRGLALFVNKYVDTVTTDVVALVDEFACRVYQELNYVQEGKNAQRFKKLYADKEEVVVPDIFWDYTCGKVLTMGWVEGVKLNEQTAIERQGFKVLNLVNTGILCCLRQLLEYGYFHADPHPGNLLATPEGKLAFIDFGMMSETPEEARCAIIGHVVHMVNRDYEAMARDFCTMKFLSPEEDISLIVPTLQNIFDDALNSTVSELNFKTIVDGLGAVMYRYSFNVPPYYVLILRSLSVLEGLALNTDPEFKVLAASYPYFARRLLTDPNPYLRDALVEMLFRDGKLRWHRLENLLIQGHKDKDFLAKDALQPILKLMLSSSGEHLRILVTKEASRVTEAIVLGGVIDAYRSIPDLVRPLLFTGHVTGPLKVSDTEKESILALRAQVFRIWRLLQSSEDFDASILEPIVQILQEPEALNLGGHIFGGIMQRFAARLLQQVLPDPTPNFSPTS